MRGALARGRPARGRQPGDAGNALVEFCVLGVLMLVPVVYLVLVLGRVEAAAFAAQRAAREAGRAFVTAADVAQARSRADAAAAPRARRPRTSRGRAASSSTAGAPTACRRTVG